MSNEDLPVLNAKGESIPEAWENSVVKLYNEGLWFERDDPQDKGRQVDSTMTIEIANPDSELFMHKYMTCGIEDLLEYEMEMLGAKDSWRKDLRDPEDHKWDYLYHERLASYPGPSGPIDQIEFLVDRLCNRPFSRRTNVITWVPERDMVTKDTPCLQSLWCVIVPGKDDSYRLNMNYRFRSRNVMVAAPMNMVAMYALQTELRDKVRERTGMNLENGRIVDMTDSYHVSVRDQKNFRNFMERLEKSKEKGEGIADRSYTREYVFQYMNEERQKIEEKIIGKTRDIWNERLEREIERIRQISAGRER